MLHTMLAATILSRTSLMHILIVDDDPDEVETLQRSLRIMGHNVTAAANGQEALRELAQSSYGADIVITDYLMPCMDGIELLKAVRSTYGQLPMVMATALGNKIVRTEAQQNGVDGFLQKPFMPEELYAAIKKIYAQGAAIRPHGRAHAGDGQRCMRALQ
jgi:CheY-like chemotaxis protein